MTRREMAFDVAVASGFSVLSILLSVGLLSGAAETGLGVAIGLAHCGALALRRRWPLCVVVAMAATAVLCAAVRLPVVILGPAVLVAVYTTGARLEAKQARLLLGGVVAVMAVVVMASGADVETVLSNAVALGFAAWLGDRSRRVAVETAATARSAVVDERLRIARELHDVVAHAISVIAVQAGSGRYVIKDSPDVAEQALSTIETTSRAALQDLRRLLTVLRDEDLVDDSLLPAPGVRAIDDLIDATAKAGVVVDVEIRGAVVELSAGVDQCVYRVVQEALTNVRKHANAQHAKVTIDYDGSMIGIEVRDDGVGGEVVAGGHGLIGMRERVELYGGAFEAGPNGCGFRVAARLPIEDAR